MKQAKAFHAKYAGTCRACGARYNVGDRILRKGDGKYIHATCGLSVVRMGEVDRSTPTTEALAARATELREAQALVSRLEAEVEALKVKAVQEGTSKPSVNRIIQAALAANPVAVR